MVLLSPSVEEAAGIPPLTSGVARRPRDLEEGEYRYGVRCDACNYVSPRQNVLTLGTIAYFTFVESPEYPLQVRDLFRL
jgi:hypothetical protein